jgi:hypothetical protein
VAVEYQFPTSHTASTANGVLHLFVNSFVNFVAFQIGWFACVLGAANGVPQLGPAAVLVILTLHLHRSVRPAREARLLLLAALIGMVWESVLTLLGLLAYPSGQFAPGLAPYWIVAMWPLFATTLNVSMRWLHGRLVLATVLGGMAGPLTYYAGSRLGGVVLVEPVTSLTALGAGWMVLMPVLVWLAAANDGFDEEVKA